MPRPLHILVIGLWLLVTPLLTSTTQARYTPEDAYQEKRASFNTSLNKISDPALKEKILRADQTLEEINLAVCFRFEEDVNHLAAIMEEFKRRQGVTETRVAFGGVDTEIENADYWVNYAAEAVAFQKIQNYTPLFNSQSQIRTTITSSMNKLENDLKVLAGKILRAKIEVGKVVEN